MTKKIFFSVFALFLALNLTANSNTDIIAQANEAYTAGKYQQAAELYKQVINNGYESAALYYNLGNAYFKMNDFPAAILYYEKSLKLNPGFEKAEYNLKVANTKIIDKIEELPVPFYQRWWNSFQRWFSVDVWAICAIVFLFMFFVLLSVYLLANFIWLRKLSFWLGILFFIFSIVSTTNAYSRYIHLKGNKEAIVFEPTVHVKSSPDAESQDIFVIHEGTKVKITDRVGQWIEIKIANGSDGWVPESVVEII